jgi:thymidylate synthase
MGKSMSNNWSEEEYQDLLHTVRHQGEMRGEERTGVGTRSRFMSWLNFDLREGFPLLTTKKVAFKSVLSELLWFIEGSQNERRLAEIHYGKPRTELRDKKTIWTANADNQGKALGHYNSEDNKDLGPVYGVQWRNWDGIDQLANVIEGIKSSPQSRRHILSAWNVADLDKMALPPCHTFSQFYVNNQGELSCNLYQRSADLFLGVPFNIASYALLTHMIAHVCDLKVGEFYHTIGDGHIYNNHIEAVDEQLSREAKKFPTLKIIGDYKSIDDFTMDSFEIVGYDPHPFIKAPMAI